MAARLHKEKRLQAEVHRARREFFPVGAPAADALPGAATAADLRFHEWFLLERESELLGAVPAVVPPFVDLAEALPDSVLGVFLVQPTAGDLVVARDLQDEADLELVAPKGALRPGDLLVGRIYDHGGGRWLPSSALSIFRPGAELGKAFQRDVQRLDLQRRLRQIELEHLLLHRNRPLDTDKAAVKVVPLEHLEADLDRLLVTSGSELSAADISQQLALAVRPGPVLGPMLDSLAFDTVVDLDRARALLLEIWNAHHEGEEQEDRTTLEPDLGSTPPGETLGERLVRTLDEGLQQKRDVGELFAQLERMAGIDPDPDEDDLLAGGAAAAAEGEDESTSDEEPGRRDATADDDDIDDDEIEDGERAPRSAPHRQPPIADGADDPIDDGTAGDLGPLVEEYLWEQGRDRDDTAAPLRLLAELQQNTALPHHNLEQVTTVDVMRLLLHVYLGSAPAARADAVHAAFGELRGFFDWAVAEQEIPVSGVLAGCQGPLLDQLDRLQTAGLHLSTPATGRLRPGILEVDDVGKDGFGARDDDGSDHWISASATALAALRPGDLVLGAMQPQPTGKHGNRTLVGLVVVLPSDARTLME